MYCTFGDQPDLCPSSEHRVKEAINQLTRDSHVLQISVDEYNETPEK